MRGFALGAGPLGSVVAPGREVLLAAAGMGRPRVLVSAGALLELDDDDLAAGLEHELAFHLERDADRCALQRRGDRLALASVICQAASTALPSGATVSIGGADVVERARELVDGPSPRRTTVARTALVLCLVALAAMLTVSDQCALALPAATEQVRHCPT